MRRCRLADRLSALEQATRRDEETIELFGIKMTRAFFERAVKNAQGTSLPVVRDLCDERR